MNMMTTMEPPGARVRMPMPRLALAQHVDRAIGLAGITPAAFARACGDAHLLRDMRDRNRQPRLATLLRMQDHADRLLRETRERAFNTLMDQFEGNDVEAAVDGLISMLDARDGDPDLEDALGTEDAFERHPRGFMADGPGCPIADGDVGDEESSGRADRTWTEWHTRGRHKLGPDGGENRMASGDADEDAEDDGDRRDAGWTEWSERGAYDQRFTDGELIGDRRATEDDELETDRCLAGDDMVRAGPVIRNSWDLYPPGWDIGDPIDAEPTFVAASMDRPFAANVS